MEKARMEQEMRIAAEIQQALMPKAGRSGAYFRAAASSLPCRSIGGDFYDWTLTPDGHLLVSIADVTGHGIGPAIMICSISGRVRCALSPITETSTGTCRQP